MRLTAALLSAAFVTPALAEAPLSIEAFDEMMTGKVMLHYLEPGAPYGTAEYLPDRRVRWHSGDGTCTDGRYYASQGAICFQYQGEDAGPFCWEFSRHDLGLIGRYDGAPFGDQEVLLRETPYAPECG